MWQRISFGGRFASRRIIAALQILILCTVACGSSDPSPVAAEPPQLRDLKWLRLASKTGGDAVDSLVKALTTIPAECLELPLEPRRAAAVKLGRVAFRSPVLLGGVASRVGISCDTCHRNGHDNPHFFVAGVSGQPGTADVTGSIFSTTREDQQKNPVPIPTLVDATADSTFGTVVPASDLASFLHAAIEGEFQGRRPPASVIKGLVAYLGELKSSACPQPPTPEVIDIRFDSDARALLETHGVLVAAFEREDLPTARFVLLSLQAAMERVYERFPDESSGRDGLIEVSRSLSAIREQISVASRDGSPSAASDIATQLGRERGRLEVCLDRLRSEAENSYYEPDFLRSRFELVR